ncbi:MAG TPA: family 43 glycosylhydrolase, partial [Verrucomicrobiae bacterium]
MNYLLGQPAVWLFCALSWLAVMVQPGLAQSPTTNTTGYWHTELHLPEIPLHDPWILVETNSRTYYLYTSNHRQVTGVDRPGTIAYRSHDLKVWEGPVLVFELPPGTWAGNQPAWAPEVHLYRGKYYLFTTLHNPDKRLAVPPENWHTNHLRGTCIAVSTSPEGPFTLLRTNAPVPPANFMTLDGTLYLDR